MLRRSLAPVLLAGLFAAPAIAEAPRTYAEMKERVAVQRFPGGRVLASSGPFAAIDTSTRYANGGKQIDAVSVLVEAWPDRPVTVSMMVSSVRPLLPTEASGSDKLRPADPSALLEARIGSPWTNTTAAVLESEVSCPGPGQWCQWTRNYRIDVSQEKVRQIVAAERQRRIGLEIESQPDADWTIPRDHLIATLDAIGLLHAFK